MKEVIPRSETFIGSKSGKPSMGPNRGAWLYGLGKKSAKSKNRVYSGRGGGGTTQ